MMKKEAKENIDPVMFSNIDTLADFASFNDELVIDSDGNFKA